MKVLVPLLLLVFAAVLPSFSTLVFAQGVTHDSGLSTNSNQAFVRFSNMTENNGFTLISGWSLASFKGTVFLQSYENSVLKREIIQFVPSVSACHYYQSECIDGKIRNSNSDKFANGDTIHIEINSQEKKIFLSTSTSQTVFGIDKIRTWYQAIKTGGATIQLGEGQKEEMILVQKINPDSITGLQFRAYPLASNIGTPVTLHIGDTVSNGCTVELTLVKISDKTATFVKKVNSKKLCPICLSENTKIDTPNGQVNVQDLKQGMSIFTGDNLGHKKLATIFETGKTLVLPTHRMVHLVLYDSRELYVSPNHPTADGRLFGNIHVGDLLDGSRVKVAQLVLYHGTYTYDILPSGQTGFYFANGILAKSTLG